MEELKKYTIDPLLHEAYVMILKQVYQAFSSEDNNELSNVKNSWRSLIIEFLRLGTRCSMM